MMVLCVHRLRVGAVSVYYFIEYYPIEWVVLNKTPSELVRRHRRQEYLCTLQRRQSPQVICPRTVSPPPPRCRFVLFPLCVRMCSRALACEYVSHFQTVCVARCAGFHHRSYTENYVFSPMCTRNDVVVSRHRIIERQRPRVQYTVHREQHTELPRERKKHTTTHETPAANPLIAPSASEHCCIALSMHCCCAHAVA